MGLSAQDASIDSIYNTAQYNFPVLPPFSAIYDSIVSRSPQILKLKQVVFESNLNLGMVKKDWMNYFSLNSAYSYGNGAMISSSSAAATTSALNVSNQQSSTYGAGFGIGLNLSSIFNYKTRVKMAKSKVDQTQYELDNSLQELKYKLFEQYTQLEMNLNAFKENSLIMEMSNAQIVISEKEYRQGLIGIDKLIVARQQYSSALVAYESLKRNCKLGVFYFEQLSGMDFRENNNQTPEE
ncbi:MAG: TolC family protein [Bacteroidales bacterium]|nr:TolC family protein [Bacteroidales bacterium]